MPKQKDELQKMHKTALKLVQEQLKKHSLGKLGFLAFIGTRPWGFGRPEVDYDYRGIYVAKEEKSYQAFISGIYINNYAKDIILISFERFIDNVLQSNIHSLIIINSPVIYVSKEFLEFRKWINSNLCKKVYHTCRTKKGHSDRKDYLYDFFFMGNGISILEQKKIIANLSKLNKKCLKIPFIYKLIEQEKMELPFKNEKQCKKVLTRLKSRLEKVNKKSRLPEEINIDKLLKLKIMKKVDYKYWKHPEFISRHEKEKRKYKLN